MPIAGAIHPFVTLSVTPPGVVQVFRSHTAHVSSGLGEGPFVADGNCDGLPQPAAAPLTAWDPGPTRTPP